LLPKPHIQKMAPGTHGGINYAELARLGIAPQDVLDFSVSTNPFGPPPAVREALAGTPIDRYPDSSATALRQELSRRLGLPPEKIIAGSGSTELIRSVALAYFGADDRVLIPQPTYGEYATACGLVGADIIKQLIREEDGFKLDTAATRDIINRQQPRGIFLCNPNNPTGQYLSRGEVEGLATAGNGLLIIDEAYTAFTGNTWNSRDMVDSGRVIIIRSMTKDYALAGLRLGYALASADIISVLQRVIPPWNISSIAQRAGVLALRDNGYLEECSARIREGRDFLIAGLTALGLPVIPSRSNFFLVKTGHAARFRQALLKKGILVRDCTSFGLPEYIRLAPRTMPENRKLIGAIKETGAYKRE